MADSELKLELLKLEQALYSSATNLWHGAPLRAAVERLQRLQRSPDSGETDELSLYPSD